jgi:hypothetical protein
MTHVEQLDVSIKNFNDSSNKAYNQINDSINKFNESSDKYSKKLIELTYAVYVFTIIVVALPIYEKVLQLFKVSPTAEIFWLLVAVVVIAGGMATYYNKIYEKKSLG